ncbi:hypothetical protein H2199_004036 [Coniosporium tulheliwenetii]|uniref:Uncharacterized protein n=1 Tax=Coniosporium tulheliwenetii TaxID=3383036 RepID=A0ACC2Z7W2_9PEZI|nr:hypothetical protein H2199_004036 [Cladosporium sp. JES 115]
MTLADDFYLFANVNFVPDKYDEWQTAYDALAAHVWAHEPTTKTYYFGIPLDYAHDFSATTSMLAFEVYGRREDLYETHFSSPAMKEFLQKIPDTMTTGLDLSHYRWRGERGGEGKLEKLAGEVGKVAETDDTGVLTFMTFESLDGETGVRMFARFRSREDMERHLRSKEVLDFWLGSKEEIASMESRGYLPNGKGWLHR